MSSNKISVVIQTFQRPSNLSKQLEAIEEQTLPPSEIIISHLYNNMTKKFKFDKKYKFIGYHRYKKPISQMVSSLIASVDSDYVVLFDDDMIPGRKFFETAVKYASERDGIWGAAGAYYDKNMWRLYDGYWPMNHKNNKVAQTDWVGGIWFVPMKYRHVIFNEPLPFDIHSGSDDIWFGYQAWKLGINRYVFPCDPKDQEKWGIIERPQAQKKMALHKGYKNHENDRIKLIKWCRSQGWKCIQDNYKIPHFID